MTARTLHHYDEIGLLTASRTEAGHRFYETNDFVTLQKIISFKFLGYPLDEIKDFLHEKQSNIQQSLRRQQQEMIAKREHLNKTIRALDHALSMIESEGELDESIFISLINSIQMEKEHKEWISENLPKQFNDILSSISEEQGVEIEKLYLSITLKLKKLIFTDPMSDEVIDVIDELFQLVTDIIGEDYLSIITSIEAADVPENDWLFPFPFSKEEELWLNEAIELYLQKRGESDAK